MLSIYVPPHQEIRKINGKRVCFAKAGDPTSPTIVLIVGLGMQMIEWPTSFINNLQKHFHVIILDNRDAGLSDKYGPIIEPISISWSWQGNFLEHTTYELTDMAQDVIDLLDFLKITKFHCLGFSMGGMIAQLIAAHHKDRVLSLTSLCSSNGTNEISCTEQAASFMEDMFKFYNSEDECIRSLAKSMICYSANALLPSQNVDTEFKLLLRRAYYPGGSYRQAKAIRASKNQTELLKTITAKSLIAHGDQDPCINISQGKHAASQIPKSWFIELSGHGHNLSEAICDKTLNWLLTEAS